MRGILVIILAFGFVQCSQPPRTERPPVASQQFLDSLSLDTFEFFWELAEPTNGNVPDRWPSPSFSSIAATGFGLTSYLVGVEKGYITREQAADRVATTLRFFLNAPKGDAPTGVTGNHGFFYHFIDMKTGLRFETVELSTIDTGLLMAGILSCHAYFDGADETETFIRSSADSLYRAVEWDWAMNGRPTMSMGWHPERGFLDASWRGYNEAMILVIMAIASPTHPIPAESWDGWTKDYQWSDFKGQEMINFGPLFGHQYSHMYIDFRGIKDRYMREKGIDYFENSRRATIANRNYCIANPADYEGYGSNVWGLTACDGPGNDNKSNPNVSFLGYGARGIAEYYKVDDGTIAPTAAGGSIPFLPDETLGALVTMKRLYGNQLYDDYGFKDAFNLSIVYNDGSIGWYDKDYLGIDQGPILIQLENHRSGIVWDIMKKSPYIRDGLKKAGFTGGWLDGSQ